MKIKILLGIFFFFVFLMSSHLSKVKAFVESDSSGGGDSCSCSIDSDGNGSADSYGWSTDMGSVDQDGGSGDFSGDGGYGDNGSGGDGGYDDGGYTSADGGYGPGNPPPSCGNVGGVSFIWPPGSVTIQPGVYTSIDWNAASNATAYRLEIDKNYGTSAYYVNPCNNNTNAEGDFCGGTTSDDWGNAVTFEEGVVYRIGVQPENYCDRGQLTSVVVTVSSNAPTNFAYTSSCANTNSQVVLSWDAVAGASGYELYRANVDGSNQTLIYSGSALGYQEVTPDIVNTGAIYLYKIRSIIGGTPSAYANLYADVVACEVPSVFNIYDSVTSCFGTSPEMRFNISRSTAAARYAFYRKVEGVDANYIEINNVIDQFSGATYTYFDPDKNPQAPLDPTRTTNPVSYFAVALNENSGWWRVSTYVNNTSQAFNTPALIKDCNIPNINLLINNVPETQNIPPIENNSRATISWGVSHADVCTGTSAITSNSGGPSVDSGWNNLSLTPAQITNNGPAIQSILFANPPTTAAQYTLTCTNNNLVDVINVRPGLLAYWNFDEPNWIGGTNEVLDYTTNANHGTLVGGATNVVDHYGKVANFSGLDQSINLGSSTSLNIPQGGSFTITGFLKTTEGEGCFLSFRNSGSGNPVIDLCMGFNAIQQQPGRLMSVLRDDTTPIGSGYPWGASWINSTGTVNDGTWKQFALTRNSVGNIELFVDGVSQGTNTFTPGAITTNLRYLGAERAWVNQPLFTADQQYFNGQLDDIRVYNRILSPDEMTQLRTGALTTFPQKTQFKTRNFLINTLKPFLQTTGGDVHTQGTIDTPGGP